MAYDYPTNFTIGNESLAVTGLGSLFTYATYATDGWFGTGLLFLIFVLVFAVSSLVDIRKSFAAASFVGLVFSVYFARLNMINTSLPFLFVAMTIIGFFLARSGTQSNY
jgi:hypothetical protein